MRCSSHWRDYNTHTHDRLSEALVLHPNDTDRTERFAKVHEEYIHKIGEGMLHYDDYMKANPNDGTNAAGCAFWLILLGHPIPNTIHKKNTTHQNRRWY